MELSEPIYLTPASFFSGPPKLCNLTKLRFSALQLSTNIKFYMRATAWETKFRHMEILGRRAKAKKSKQGARRGRWEWWKKEEILVWLPDFRCMGPSSRRDTRETHTAAGAARAVASQPQRSRVSSKSSRGMPWDGGTSTPGLDAEPPYMPEFKWLRQTPRAEKMNRGAPCVDGHRVSKEKKKRIGGAVRVLIKNACAPVSI